MIHFLWLFKLPSNKINSGMSFSIRRDVLISHSAMLQFENQDRVSSFKQKKWIISNNCVTSEVKFLFLQNQIVPFWLKNFSSTFAVLTILPYQPKICLSITWLVLFLRHFSYAQHQHCTKEKKRSINHNKEPLFHHYLAWPASCPNCSH